MVDKRIFVEGKAIEVLRCILGSNSNFMLGNKRLRSRYDCQEI